MGEFPSRHHQSGVSLVHTEQPRKLRAGGVLSCLLRRPLLDVPGRVMDPYTGFLIVLGVVAVCGLVGACGALLFIGAARMHQERKKR